MEKYRVWLSNEKKLYDINSINYDKKTISVIAENGITCIYSFEDPTLAINVCTNFKDKNDKEIFTGDILTRENWGYGIVTHGSGGYCVEWDLKEITKPLGKNSRDFLILGNIYQGEKNK